MLFTSPASLAHNVLVFIITVININQLVGFLLINVKHFGGFERALEMQWQVGHAAAVLLRRVWLFARSSSRTKDWTIVHKTRQRKCAKHLKFPKIPHFRYQFRWRTNQVTFVSFSPNPLTFFFSVSWTSFSTSLDPATVTSTTFNKRSTWNHTQINCQLRPLNKKPTIRCD